MGDRDAQTTEDVFTRFGFPPIEDVKICEASNILDVEDLRRTCDKLQAQADEGGE